MSAPLRIAYVTDQLLPQDATDTAQLANMVSALGRAGAEVRVVAPWRRGSPPPDLDAICDYYDVDPSFRVIPARSVYPNIRGIEKLAHAWVATTAPAVREADLVYTRNIPAVLATLRRTDRPVFYETYRPWPRQTARQARRFGRLAREPRLRGLILHSALAASSYAEVGFSEDRLLVAHNGYDPRVVGSDPGREAARSKVDLPDDGRLVVTYAGHISPKKGLGLVLDLAEALADKARFVLVGSKGPGPIERRAEAMENVTIVGWQAFRDTVPWLYASDVLLIPPTRGPLDKVGNTVLPIKTFLYMATGRAIFAPDSPDLREVLADDVNAALVAPDDHAAAVARLGRLLDDEAGRVRLGAAALADARERTWDRRADHVLAWIRARLDPR